MAGLGRVCVTHSRVNGRAWPGLCHAFRVMAGLGPVCVTHSRVMAGLGRVCVMHSRVMAGLGPATHVFAYTG